MISPCSQLINLQVLALNPPPLTLFRQPAFLQRRLHTMIINTQNARTKRGSTKPEKKICQFTHLPFGVINERITRITPSCHLAPINPLNRDACRGQLELCHKQLAIS